MLNEFPRRCQADDGTRTRDLKNGGSAKDDLLKMAENAKEPPRKWTEPRSRRLFLCSERTTGQLLTGACRPPIQEAQYETSICFGVWLTGKRYDSYHHAEAFDCVAKFSTASVYGARGSVWGLDHFPYIIVRCWSTPGNTLYYFKMGVCWGIYLFTIAYYRADLRFNISNT